MIAGQDKFTFIVVKIRSPVSSRTFGGNSDSGYPPDPGVHPGGSLNIPGSVPKR